MICASVSAVAGDVVNCMGILSVASIQKIMTHRRPAGRIYGFNCEKRNIIIMAIFNYAYRVFNRCT